MKTTVTKKLSNELKEFVTRIVSEVINDPDFGMELTEEAKSKLGEAQSYKGKNMSSAEVKEKYL